jgi:hypothetical protein
MTQSLYRGRQDSVSAVFSVLLLLVGDVILYALVFNDNIMKSHDYRR